MNSTKMPNSSLVTTESAKRSVEMALQEAKKQGAHQVEVGLSYMDGFSTSVRLGEVETLERDLSHSLSATVYINGAKGSASTTDLSERSIGSLIQSACSIAKYTQSDEHAGLADASLMAWDYQDLDLYHPWGEDAADVIPKAIEIARETEAAARSFDSKISNSEGSHVNSHKGFSVYGNSHGFIGVKKGSNHGISCSVVAGEHDAMQSDYWYSSHRVFEQLESAQSIGKMAAQRAIEKLNPQSVCTQICPVLFSPSMARGLIGHFFSAISGCALYRKTSFLLDKKGEPIFPDFMRIQECPHILQGLSSASFDAEGVATRERDWVVDGKLQDYVLSSYSARRLGLETTGNAGGVRNVFVSPYNPDPTLAGMLKTLDRGLYITEMMGQGVNTLTGDYSRGATGFWVENGQIQYPVSGITVAGNLLDMFANIVAIGDDALQKSNINVGSMLINDITIAGQ